MSDTITLPREVVELALKALEDSVDCVLASAAPPRGLRKRGSEAITALREALAAEQPKQEPLAWRYKGEPWFDGDRWHDNHEVTTSEQVAKFKDKNAQPLYAAIDAAMGEKT